MQKKKIIFLIGGIILFTAGIMLFQSHVQQREQAVKQQIKKQYEAAKGNEVPVLVAKKDIPRGAAINPDDLNASIVPKQHVQPQAVTSLDRIADMVTIAPILAGEQVTLSKLSLPSQARGGLAEVTPAGKRAVSISVDNLGSLVGMIKPRDHVDVSAIMAIPVPTPEGKTVSQSAVLPLFQDVLVLAVGQQLGPSVAADSRYKQEDKKAVSSSLITLALKPQEANLIAFVQEQGKITLTMRSPGETKVEPIQPANWDTLFMHIMPREIAAAKQGQAQKQEVREPTDYVEVYRGLKKEMIPLSK